MIGPWTMPMVVNAALVQLGQKPTYSVDSDDRRAGIVEAIWPALVDRCFSLHDWTWTRRTRKLLREATAPGNGWAVAHTVPGDLVGPPLALFADAAGFVPLRNYTIEGNQVLSNETVVYARGKVLVDPPEWEPGFRAAFIIALEGMLAVPLIADANRRDAKLQEAFGTPSQGGAGGAFGRLIAQDRAAAPLGVTPFLRDDPLTSARYS